MSYLKDYYRVKTNKELIKSIFEDFLVSIFLFSGSGLFTSILKGCMSRFFIKSGFPVLIGKRFRVRHPANIKMGKRIVIKDDVSLCADGPISIGDNFLVGEKSILSSWEVGLFIGSNVMIGKNCYIAQNGGKITIGNNVLIADGVKIYSLNHTFSGKDDPVSQQKPQYSDIKINNNVWVGAGAVIFNNISIGKNSVIGANSVVRESVPDNVVFAGNPGKIIRKIK